MNNTTETTETSTYTLRDDQGIELTIDGVTLDQARERAEEWVLDGCYSVDKTEWVEVQILRHAGTVWQVAAAQAAAVLAKEAWRACECAQCVEGEAGECPRLTAHLDAEGAVERLSARKEVDTVIVTVEAPEPACEQAEHEWTTPHAIVGGLRENPGVRGNGGGVICHEVCLACCCTRITDTWATGPSGQQGYTSVRYDEERYADEIREYTAKRAGEPGDTEVL